MPFHRHLALTAVCSSFCQPSAADIAGPLGGCTPPGPRGAEAATFRLFDSLLALLQRPGSINSQRTLALLVCVTCTFKVSAGRVGDRGIHLARSVVLPSVVRAPPLLLPPLSFTAIIIKPESTARLSSFWDPQGSLVLTTYLHSYYCAITLPTTALKIPQGAPIGPVPVDLH